MKLNEYDIIAITQSKTKSISPVGIGDDAALTRANQLIATDCLIENVHFSRNQPAHTIGHKALAVNLSDIAAMGGRPSEVLLSVGLPTSLDMAWYEQFIEGFSNLANLHHVEIIGGDTCRSPRHIFVSVTILGHPPDKPVLRSTAASGDLIGLIGFPGASAAGLRAIQEENSARFPELVMNHYLPRPLIEWGQILASTECVSSMMDVSDGLVPDLEKLCKSSDLGAAINFEALPVGIEMRKFCDGNTPLLTSLLLEGGEDYGLLFTVAPDSWNHVRTALARAPVEVPISQIGFMKSESGIAVDYRGQAVAWKRRRFEHF